MADGEVERLVTVFDADFAKLEAKLNAVIRAQYSAAGKIGDQWKRVQADSKMDAALTQAAALKNIQLENQLSVARAAGNKAQIKALTEELLLEAQLAKLKRAGITGDAASAAAHAHLASLSAAEKAAEGVNLGKAATSVFDASRFAVIEEGSAKLRVFGSSLEALGPIGIGAAVGVVAAAVAIENVKKAVEEVGALKVKADKFGISIEALQELEFAAKESHVPVEALNEAVGGLSLTLGKLRSGVGAARLKELAAELMLSPEELQQAKTAADILPILADRIKALPSASEQYAAAAKANVLEILPLLVRGGDGVRELMAEYHRLGVEISGPTAAGIEEGNIKMERAHDLAHDKLRNSLINLGPVLVKLSTLWDNFAGGAVDALNIVLRISDAVLGAAYGGQHPFEAKPGAPGGKAAAGAAAASGPTRAQIEAEKTANAKLDELSAEYVTHSTHRLAAEKKIEEINAARAAAGDKPIDKARADKILAAAAAQDAKPGERAASAAQRKAEEAARKLEAARVRQKEEVDRQTQEIDTAEKDELAARTALVTNVVDLAQLRKDEVDAATKKKNDEAKARLEAVTLAKGSTEAEKAAARATWTWATALNDKAAAEKKQAIDARLADDQARTRLAIAEAADQGQIAAMEAAKALAVTAVERRDLELKILKIQQDEARARLEAVVASKTATDAEKKVAQAQLAALPQVQGAQTAQVQAANRDPVQQYLASIQDLNTEIQGDGVQAARSLASGLAEAVVNAHDLGDVASSVFRQLISQILAQTLERDVTGPAVAAILALADGGPVRGPGTSTSDSIPAQLSDGEFVVRASAARRHRPLLEAINSGKVMRLAAGGPVGAFPAARRLTAMTPPAPTQARGDVNLNIGPISAEGAITRDAIEGMVRTGSQRAVVAARELARGDVARLQYDQSLNA